MNGEPADSMHPHPGRGAADPTKDHSRLWQGNRFVYPVISRRSGGLSVGVNLNPNKFCNFACVYCQVDRRDHAARQPVVVAAIERELRGLVEEFRSGRLWDEQRFSATPPSMRRLCDIAFSGDGEPTCVPQLADAVEAACRVRREMELEDTKILLITNASHLHTGVFREARRLLDENNGEIWVKLDAGTEAFFRRVNRPHPSVTLEKILTNVLGLSVARPIVVQTLFFRLGGEGPAPEEISAYCRNLRHILAGGGQIRQVQIHTVARPPAETDVRFLAEADLQAIAEQVRAAAPGVDVRVYPGHDVPPQPGAETD